jgi:hypothetical protein
MPRQKNTYTTPDVKTNTRNGDGTANLGLRE